MQKFTLDVEQGIHLQTATHKNLNPFRSVRGRLTLWQTAVLAIVLVLGATIAYAFFRETTLERIDQGLSDTADAFAQSLTSDQFVAGDEDNAVRDGLNEFRFRDLFIVVYDTRLQVVGVSMPDPSRQYHIKSNTEQSINSLAQRVLRADHPRVGFVRLRDRKQDYRMYTTPMAIGQRTYILAVVQSLEEEQEALQHAKTTAIIAIPLIVIIAGLGGALLADRSLAPVAAMTKRAARIGAGDVNDRLPVHNPHDELGRLAQVFNDLLSRLHETIDRQRQFMADASHELRTPTAIVLAEVEVTMAKDQRSEAEYRETLTTIGSSARRLSAVIDNLFLLARADTGQYPVTRTPTYLTDIVSESVKALRTLSEQRAIILAIHLPDDDAAYEGDVELLHRLVMNLVDNALKYGASHTMATVTLRASPDQYAIEVANEGPTIPPDMQSHIFDRFAQIRSTAVGYRGTGAGLGLPIARWIAEMHGGTVELVRSEAGGTVFRCILPH